MAKDRIRDIIDRELIVRVSKNNYTQEYGMVGTDTNIMEVDGKTIFMSQYKIAKVVFVTINGVTQALSRDYTKINDFTLEFNGKILNGKTIAIGYFFENITRESVKFPPRLDYFVISPTAGRDSLISFSFLITKNNAKNIFWSIHKEGDATPLTNRFGKPLTGTSIDVDGVDGTKEIKYQLSYQESIDKAGQEIPFTLIVVYDLTEDGTSLDEKLIGDAIYSVDNVTGSKLDIELIPETKITVPTLNKVFDLIYSVEQGSYTDVTWRVVGPGSITIDSGTEADLPSDKQTSVTHSFDHTSSNLIYTLYVEENGEVVSAKDTVIVDIVPVARTARSARVGMDSQAQYIVDKATYQQYMYTKVDGTPSDIKFTLNNITKPNAGQSTPRLNATIGINDGSTYKTAIEVPRAWGSVTITLDGNPLNIPGNIILYPNVNDAASTDDMIDAYITTAQSTEATLPTTLAVKRN